MDRKEFLSKLGLGAAFVLTATCLGSCAGEVLAPMGNVDFTLDLTDPSNSKLANNGGYIIKDRVVVAKDMSGNYVAATQRCSHDGTHAIILKDNEWFCTDHAAKFNLEGTGLNEKGKKNLTVYTTQLTGNLLRVFS